MFCSEQLPPCVLRLVRGPRPIRADQRRRRIVRATRARLPLLQILSERRGKPIGALIGRDHGLGASRDSTALTRALRSDHRRAPSDGRSCCRSSVVERILGKAEVVSSILTLDTQ